MSDLPQSLINPTCEREFLATTIANPTLAPLACEKLKPEDLRVPLHARILRAIVQIISEGKQCNEFAIDGKLSSDPEYVSAGGLKFLIELSSSAVPFSPQGAIDGLAESLLKLSIRRRFREATSVATDRAGDPLNTIDELILNHRENITQLEDESEMSRRGMVHVSEISRELTPTLMRLSEKPGEMLGLSTGFPRLDRKSSGLPPGSLTIIAARPSMGKTAFMLNVAERVARAGNPVAIFSLETPRDMLQLRLACRHGRIDLSALTSGRAGEEVWRQLPSAIAEVSRLPIYVDDRPRPKATDLRWRIRAAARRFNAKLVILDYLQLATARGDRDTRNDEVATVSGELQAAAREIGNINGGTLLVASQLNRVADGERPRLSHLRDSGAIEQDADAVWLLCEAAGSRPGQVEPFVKELEIAKSRNGPTGTVQFDYIGQCMAFEERV